VTYIAQSGAFNNVSEAKAIREEVKALEGENNTLIIVIAVLGGVIGLW
jgi:hypothetical protein